VKRREFITLLTGAAAWPLAARAQQPAKIRRIGVLMSPAPDDALGQTGIAAFAQGLQQLGWEVGANIRIDYRWGANDTERHADRAAAVYRQRPRRDLWGRDSVLSPVAQSN
jgi:putative ABC transport system substrate-binding protein